MKTSLTTLILVSLTTVTAFAATEENIHETRAAKAGRHPCRRRRLRLDRCRPGDNDKVVIDAHRKIEASSKEKEEEYFKAVPVTITTEGDKVIVRAIHKNESFGAQFWHMLGHTRTEARYTFKCAGQFQCRSRYCRRRHLRQRPDRQDQSRHQRRRSEFRTNPRRYSRRHERRRHHGQGLRRSNQSRHERRPDRSHRRQGQIERRHFGRQCHGAEPRRGRKSREQRRQTPPRQHQRKPERRNLRWIRLRHPALARGRRRAPRNFRRQHHGGCTAQTRPSRSTPRPVQAAYGATCPSRGFSADDDSLKGTINGGGTKLVLRSSAGSIEIVSAEKETAQQ